MKIVDTEISDVKIIEPTVFGDERGFFMETFRENWFGEDLGLDVSFVQDNHSASNKGVLRGLHYQKRNPQGKLVRVIEGEVFDVAVDIRESSPTFGNYVGIHLSSKNKKIFWVPPGFAHGFLVLSEKAQFVYKCTEYYAPEDEVTLLWNDQTIAIAWPLDNQSPQLSKKDSLGLPLEKIESL